MTWRDGAPPERRALGPAWACESRKVAGV